MTGPSATTPEDAYSRFLRAAVPDPERFAGVQTVRLEQRGTMRTKPGARWLDFTATQTIAVRETSFEWVARFKAMPGVWFQVTDRCTRGSGQLLVKPWGKITVSRLEGRDADIGQVLRYLGEIIWCPLAAVDNPELRHESVSEDVVRFSTLSHGEQRSVDFHLDDSGKVRHCIGAKRPMIQGKRVTERPWFGNVLDYGQRAGLWVPSQVEVAWDLESERFVYFRGELTAFELESSP